MKYIASTRVAVVKEMKLQKEKRLIELRQMLNYRITSMTSDQFYELNLIERFLGCVG